VADRIRERADVRSVFVNGGNLLGSGAEVRKATLIINLVPKDQRKLKQHQIKGEIGQQLSGMPDIRYWFLNDDGQRQFQLVVAGRDPVAVNKAAAEVTSEAKRLPQLANVVSTAELDRPELRVYPKSDIAAELGISTDAISEAVRIATIGDVAANLAKFDVGDRQVPIRVQLDEKARTDRHILEALKVSTASGAAVPLSAVADFEMSQGPTAIDRYDRTRRIVIGGDLVGDAPLGDVVNALMSTPAAKHLPAGVELKQFGAAEIMAEVFESFAQAMIAGLMMVYAVLVLLFGSFLQPITILFSLPLSIGGAIAALLVTGKQLTTPVWIGILMLMGIVTKNAIMLVEFAIEAIRAGKPREEAMIDAGMKRARPIVMTTIAMAAGMIPSALAVGAGGEFRSPMALAVIGGLIFSTILSLVFVPAMFMVMDDFGALIWRFAKRLIVHSEDAETDDHHEAAPAQAGPAPKSLVHPAAE
jgi:multidrug efflux pump subunit AcrB